ncbi:hypothetical protein SLEP1_g53698 [Rubroshorea leprosula]|uniref:NAC domain-containing protein n=1 Tax=Rubroshorea leprosula TaxID=152421 RepID=A0AAV5MB46_9ROSI|nr:hypothetical protein SLEP1_g53698 [Rubroshorea leprosula]
MDPTAHMGMYFWEREPKTEGSQRRFNRVIQTNAGNSKWDGCKRLYIEDHDDTMWAVKRTFNHEIDREKTGWMMKEYVLDPSRVEARRNANIAFCIIYKNRATSNSRPAAAASWPVDYDPVFLPYFSYDDDPQPNQMIQNAVASPSTLVAPWTPGIHSGDDTQSIMSLDQIDPTTVEPRTTDIFSTLPPDDYLQSPWILDEVTNFEYDQ